MLPEIEPCEIFGAHRRDELNLDREAGLHGERIMLGHKSIKTTVEFYVRLEQEHSFKRYEAVLDSYSAQGGNHVVG